MSLGIRTRVTCAAVAVLGGVTAPNAFAEAALGQMDHAADVLSGIGAQAVDNPRMEWWRDAKLGMFIHWGPYAALKGDCRGKNVPFPAEWSRHALRIPDADYRALALSWNPSAFDANAWVELARRGGMKYMILTAKHHDGFSLFDAPGSDFKITRTPFGRDVVDELYHACERGGVRFGAYYSPRDWDHSDYPCEYERNAVRGKCYGGWYSRKGAGPDGDCGCWGCKAGLPFVEPPRPGNYTKYLDWMRGQILYLLERYPHLSNLWFDGQDYRVDEARTEDLLADIRRVNPAVIVNDRIGYTGFHADHGCAEQFVPGTSVVRDWETCLTIPRWSWGWDPNADTMHTPAAIIRHFVDIVAKGGNLLLNVSPDDLGRIPGYQQERIVELGRWLGRFGDGIYGSRKSPLSKEIIRDDLRFTSVAGKTYVFQVQDPGSDIRIPGYALKEDARVSLADGSCAVRWENSSEGLHFRLGELPVGVWMHEPVIALLVEGEFIRGAGACN